MKRRIKLIAPLVVAVFTLGAGGASGALAAEFHSAKAPTTISGTQTTGNVWTTNAGTWTCKTFTETGTLSSLTSASLRTTPATGTCTAFGFINIPVHTNGCQNVLYASGTAEIDCPVGKGIELTIPGCTTVIGDQHIASGTAYTTGGTSPNRDLNVQRNYSGIHYVECGTTRTNMTWKGSSTFVGSAGEIWYA